LDAAAQAAPAPIAPKMPVVAREAAAGREVELPVVEAACEHAVFDFAEAGQVGLPVRAEALDPPSVALEELVGLLASLPV